MAYKIKKLVDSGFKFNEVYPDKIQSIKDTTGMDYDLQTIVDFLQKQTADFTIENPVAKDIDEAIYSIAQSYIEQTGQSTEEATGESTPAPAPEVTPAPEVVTEDIVEETPAQSSSTEAEVSDDIREINEKIEELQLLAELGDEEAINMIEELKFLLS